MLSCTAPPIHPVAVGVNVTTKSTLCPAAKAIGKLRLVTLNPLPDNIIDVMVTVDELVLVTVRGWVTLEPITTLPNRTKLGLAVSSCEFALTLAGIMPNKSATAAMKIVSGRKERDFAICGGRHIARSVWLFPMHVERFRQYI